MLGLSVSSSGLVYQGQGRKVDRSLMT
ncbi:uncharacterized protein METZ01_LOCUS228915, partial [marine metagenome]